MKTFHLLILGALFCWSCEQKNETIKESNDQLQNSSWVNSIPKQLFENSKDGFLIPKQAFAKALELEGVHSIRFVLQVIDNQLLVKVVGADAKGNLTKGVLAEPVSQAKSIDKLKEIRGERFVTKHLTKTVKSHVMQPKDAIKFIDRWETSFDKDSFSEVFSYDEVRVEYFSLPASVGREIVSRNTEYVSLVWGLNDQHKFTTILLPGISKEGTLFRSQEPIFEYSSPCPPTCPKE